MRTGNSVFLTDKKIKKACSEFSNHTVNEFGDLISSIILYGSCARNNYRQDSDIDVAVLIDGNYEDASRYDCEIAKIAADVSFDNIVVLNSICIPKKEFDAKKSWYPYYLNISKEGIFLYE